MSEAKKSGKASKSKKPVEKGDETVVGPLPGERTFDIEVLDGPVPPPASAASSTRPATVAWSPIASEPAGGWGAPSTSGQSPGTGRPASVRWTNQDLPAWRQNIWKAFPILAGILLLAVVVQVYLAGAAIWKATPSWEAHKTFVHVLEFIPILMIIVGFIGGRKAAGWWSVGLFAAISLQYGLASIYNMSDASRNLQFVGALHVVNALFIFGVALLLAKRYSSWMHRKPSA